jgi:hypothetical protein
MQDDEEVYRSRYRYGGLPLPSCRHGHDARCSLQKDSKPKEDATTQRSHGNTRARYKDTSRRTALCSAARPRSLSAAKARDGNLGGSRRSRRRSAHRDDGSIAAVGRLGSAGVVGTINSISNLFPLRGHWVLQRTDTHPHKYFRHSHSLQHTAFPTPGKYKTATSGCTA